MDYVLKSLKNEIEVTRIANIHFFEFEKSFLTEADSHPFLELVFVSSGELTVQSDDWSGKLCKNEMILHRAGELHSLSCSSDNAPTIIIIGFVCECEALSALSRAPHLLRDGEIKQLAEIVKEGRNVFAPPYDVPTRNMKKKKEQPFGAEQLLRGLLEHFLITLIRDWRAAPGESSGTLRTSPAIREIVSYVDANFLEKITIGELAFLFKTNRATLCRDFKQETGMTLISYVNEKKLTLAKERIAHSDDTFTAIAAALRFESIHYFTRFFKKHTGVTPKEWRHQKRQTPTVPEHTGC